ncbi:hypothetical protein CI238_04939 [Colletotrichum incanum]|uniref:Apple domain-containing protein n=1 Tax=Colletotrichum incanum TaxID=1573173 RepID=A0A161X341_COLIC|nr:hypothetical protein CI238_04939 [Colletotrichum incanum]
MQYAMLLGAIALLAGGVKAAPKASDEQLVAHIVQGRNPRPDPQSGEWVHAVAGRGRPEFHFNGTVNATSPAGTGTVGVPTSSAFSLPHNTTSSTSSFHASGCPQSVTTSTTTVDVTFYITATTSYGGNLTSSRGTGTSFPSSALSSQVFVNSTSSRAAWNISSTSMRFSTGYTLPANSSHASTTISSTTVFESPCPENTTNTQLPHPNITSSLSSHYSSSSLATGSSSGTTTSVPVWYNTTSSVPSQTTEPCDDDVGSTSRFNSTSTVLSTQLNSTAPWPTKTSTRTAQGTRSSGATTTYTIATSNIPHINSTTNYTLSTKTQDGTLSQTVSIISSSTTECDDEATVSAAPTDASSSAYAVSSSWTTRTPTVTPFLSNTSSIAYSTQTMMLTTTSAGPSSSPIPSESCVIDTSMVPVTSAPLTSVPASTLVPTKTVCQEDAPTGKPKPGNNHCGVHGLPVGNYFLARFVENAPGVPVTLEGCYQFCASVMDATNGCKAYRFYPERGLNVPRCDLYGSSVAYALDSINNDHPDMWFDLTCGSPSDERWAHLPGMTRLRELGLLE